MTYVRLELDQTALPSRHASLEDCDGALVIVRNHGIPVGSAFLRGALPADRSLADLIEYRSGAPVDAPAPTPLSIAVTVCTRDRPELLARCLDALLDAVRVAGDEVDAQLVVVDNASPDERTADVAASRGALVLREDVPGLDVARNCAVRSVTSEVITFVDDDVVVDPTWLRTLARAFHRYPDAVAITGGVLALRLDSEAQFEFERCGGFFKSWRAGILDRSSRRGFPFNPSIGVGCNMAFRISAFERVGEFDEALDTGRPLAGGGDLDMLCRFALDGMVVYEPSALVFHEHRRTHADLRRQYLSWGKSWGAVLHKWYRSSPVHRSLLRRVAVRYALYYVRDLVSTTAVWRLRTSNAALMIVGYAAGLTTAYPRSQRRMAKRRLVAAASVA